MSLSPRTWVFVPSLTTEWPEPAAPIAVKLPTAVFCGLALPRLPFQAL